MRRSKEGGSSLRTRLTVPVRDCKVGCSSNMAAIRKVLIIFLAYFSFVSHGLKNVLFIAVDDLRTELEIYGSDYVKTPNIDALASESIVFERAYCQVAVCSPSRASLLTGRRPDTNRVWRIDTEEYWRLYTNATTIPQYFKENGYITVGMGKVFHPGLPSGNDDVMYSWSPEGLPYYHSPLQERYGPAHNHTSSWWSFGGFEDDQLPDGDLSNRAVSVVQQFKQNRSNGDNRPFFLAVGFHKPHLPFYAPKRYFDMYPRESIKLPENFYPPNNIPFAAWSPPQELFGFYDFNSTFLNKEECLDDAKVSIYGKACRVSDSKALDLRRAYYSCISYVDAQIGKVIHALKSSGLADETIIVLWGDHGWQLGEHNEWAKHTNFEDATHVPFILRVPGATEGGMRTKALVELIDIFPSLAELAGLEVPPLCPKGSHNIFTCVEGDSVAPLLKDPGRQWKKAAFSQYPRPYSGLRQIPGHSPFPNENGENLMGYTIRVENFRFTEWYRFNHTTGMPYWRDRWGTELYNHTAPTLFFNDENDNVAGENEEEVEKLRGVLQAGWRLARP